MGILKRANFYTTTERVSRLNKGGPSWQRRCTFSVRQLVSKCPRISRRTYRVSVHLGARLSTSIARTAAKCMKSRFGTLTSAAPCKVPPWTEPLCLAGAVLWDSCYRPPFAGIAQRPRGLYTGRPCLNERSGFGRVEMWRGGFRPNISVAASFVWRCLSGSAMTPFPHPAHRTGQADLPHPALGQDLTP